MHWPQTANLGIPFFPSNLQTPSEAAHGRGKLWFIGSMRVRQERLQKPYDKMMAQSSGQNMLKSRLEGLCSRGSQEKSPVNTVCASFRGNIHGWELEGSCTTWVCQRGYKLGAPRPLWILRQLPKRNNPDSYELKCFPFHLSQWDKYHFDVLPC